MNWINNIRTTALLLAIISLIKPTAGLVFQASKDKGYFECEYSSLPFLSFEWAKVPEESTGLTASLIVYQPSKLYGEINANTWHKSTNGSSILDREEEKIRFNINAGTVDVLDSKTGLFETVQLTDPTRLVSYIPHANGSSSPLEISLPNPGFYCVQAYYEISDTISYSLTEHQYDEIRRKDFEHVKYYGPQNRTIKSDKQYVEELAADYLPKVDFFDSQYRAMYENIIGWSRNRLLTLTIWPSSLFMIIVSFFIKRAAVKRQVRLYASFGLVSTVLFVVKWGTSGQRYYAGGNSGIDSVDNIFFTTYFGFFIDLLVTVISIACVGISLLPVEEIEDQKPIYIIHVCHLIPLAVVYYMTCSTAEVVLLVCRETNLINGTVIGVSCKKFQDGMIAVTTLSCVVLFPIWSYLPFRQLQQGFDSWLAEKEPTCGGEVSRLIKQTSLLYRFMLVLGLASTAMYGFYIFETRNRTTIAALDSIADASWARLLYSNRDFCLLLAFMWTGFALLVPMIFAKEIEDLEVGDIPLANLKSDSEESDV
ncbi:hypothetical protein WICPIJ_001609 [Wickerhamomyces pijperi]|uniref:Uncharacterized protein n=1 Tax=Wickerhamomyces pijperi TaxID=599730 RepID=A0A9P8TQY8_WICPI|nr:hypothetical protein WICPIJ_001609 [Wickerhamomyces pijperi]